MGFLEVFSRMLQGKPAFQASDAETPVPAKDTDVSIKKKSSIEENRFVDKSGKKIIPKIEIENVVSHRHGDMLTVTAWVKNHSELEIEIDKITILGSKHEIDRRLNPGHGHEIILYKGEVLKNEHDHKVTLQYKIVENGDYFIANYSIEFKYEPDGRYMIKELNNNNGVRDI